MNKWGAFIMGFQTIKKWLDHVSMYMKSLGNKEYQIRSHGHKTCEYKVWYSKSKSSNKNIVFTGYDFLIGYF